MQLAKENFEQERKIVLAEYERKLKVFEEEEIFKQKTEMDNFMKEINLKSEREKNVTILNKWVHFCYNPK